MPRWLLAALILSPASPRASGQVVEAYSVNDGRNDAHDIAFGEFGPDLGSTIYFSRYRDVNPLTGHVYARNWPPGPPGTPTFVDFMLEHMMDFDQRVASLSPSVAPMMNVNVFADPRAVDTSGNTQPPAPLPLPIRNTAWWPGTGPGGLQEVLYWPFKVNGGSVMICMAGDGNGYPIGPNSKSLLIYNYYNHPSSFGTNKNRFDDDNPDGWPREFSRVSAFGNQPFAEAFWEGPGSTPLLGPKEQAIRDGDIVVFVQENYDMAISTALLRTQEAVWFTRNLFAPNVPGVDPPLALTIEGAYPHGNSFGQAMAAFLALAQPQYYRGVVDWITSDLGFEMGDFSELQFHFSAGLDRGNFYRTAADNFFPDMYAFIDQLGIRFDDAQFGEEGWDIAAFSLNRRPWNVNLPMNGHVGEHEFQFPGSWSANDHTLFAAGSAAKLTLYRNRSHEEAGGVIPGVNEYGLFTGNEWSNAKNSNPPASHNRIVPRPPSAGGPSAPLKPYPDPYSHTLRPPPSGPVGGNVLTQIDARAGMDRNDPNHPDDFHGDGYRHPTTPSTPHPIKGIGHGIYPGYRDQMRVGDLDADGEMEVVFGNLGGYVHILQFAGNGTSLNGNPDDPYRLVDEWQSPRLGPGVFACDALFGANNLATMFFADARGQIWRINTLGANSYAVANLGQPIVTPDPSNPLLYDGATPLLLLADFDGGNPGSEILVMNRFFDWSLFSLGGLPIVGGLGGRLTRSTRTNGPTDAFIVESGVLAGDAQKEVLLSSTNGGAWLLDRRGVGASWTWSQPQPVLPPMTCSREKVIPCNFVAGATPSHLLSFCTDSDRDDEPPPPGGVTGPSVIELFSASFNSAVPSQKLAEIDGGGDAFAWIEKPKPSSASATFAVAGGTTISTYQIGVNSSGGGLLTALSTINLAADYDPDVLLSDKITSIECAPLEPASGPKTKRLVYATSKGRIHTIGIDLVSSRDSSEEFGATLPTPPGGGNPYAAWPSWPSNRALSQVPACDLVAPKDLAGLDVPDQGNFYFAEYTVPAFRQPVGNNDVPRYRVGRIGIGTGVAGGNEWQAFVTGPQSGRDWEALRPTWTRSLSVDDFITSGTGVVQPDGVLEFRVFTETGATFVDADAGSGPAVREFQTSSRAPRSTHPVDSVAMWLAAIAAGYPTREQFGGRVFEVLASRGETRYWHLGFPAPPPDPGALNRFFTNGSSSGPWWYPTVSTNIVDGQIASNMQSAHELSLGTSMKVGRIRVSPTATETTPHVVVGTTGGYVYAIEPEGNQPDNNDRKKVASTLRHLSTHLGTYVVGLDTGNLDGDAEGGDIDDEIACGTWMDNGTFTDWHPVTPDLTKNRAHLYVFDPVVTGGSDSFMTQVAVLDGDDLLGAGNGISSGVTGVRIDNVDGDDDFEIWCTDATGYIYLFAKDAAEAWHCVYRSDDYCAYPGFYNNLHPIKGAGGKTTKLAVQSPGYFLLFSVDSLQITFP